MGRDKNRFAITTVAICVNVLKEKNKLEKSILSWTVVAAATTPKILENKITSAFRAPHNHTHVHIRKLFITKLNRMKKKLHFFMNHAKIKLRKPWIFFLNKDFLTLLWLEIFTHFCSLTQLLCTYLLFFSSGF